MTTRSRRRFSNRLTVVVALLLLAGCGWFAPPDPPEPEPDELFEIAAGQPVAAGQLVIAHGAGTTVVTVDALRGDLSVSAATSGTSTVVAWVGGSAAAGKQVQIGFLYPGQPTQPVVANAKAYANSDGADLGVTLVFTGSAGTAGDHEPLNVLGIDHAQDDPAGLDPDFANYRLGDVNADGAVSALDALKIRELADGDGASAHQLYHSDLDGDYDTDADDVQRALDKAVDPSLPASLVVKPKRLTYVQLAAEAADDPLVLIANGGNEQLAGLGWSDTEIAITEIAGIAGQSVALSVGTAPDRDWLPETLVISASEGASAAVMLGNLVVMVAGQSNASGRGAPVNGWPEEPVGSVRMLGNNFRWRAAQEPLDSPAGQTDAGQDDSAMYSFGTRLGHLLRESLGFTTYLLPAAKGGSSLTPGSEHGHWDPPGNRLDRNTLFGAANFRAHVSAGRVANPSGGNEFAAEGGPVNVIVWYQGESEDTAAERAGFKANTAEVIGTFDTELGAHFLTVQLASEFGEQLNVQYHAVAELQRQMESDGLPMVVAHDLPRSDQRHLSAFGQRVLAERISLAIREHVFAEDVDGTGPRLLSSNHSGNQVLLEVDKALVPGELDETYFLIFDGPPSGTLDDINGTYYQNAISVASANVEASDPTTIVLTLDWAPSSTPYVRFMTPPGRWVSGGSPNLAQAELIAAEVPRGAESDLPLPTFGPLPSPWQTGG